jgi:hypothetical protein
MSSHVTDMRKRAATLNETLYYARPDVLEVHVRYGTIIRRPLEWFLTDLATLAAETHPDLLLCWIRDALAASTEAAEFHLFTGAGDWRGMPTLARAHLIGDHGYKYLSFGFVLEPDPHWCVIGARGVQVWDRAFRAKIDDGNYARDATRLW